MKRSGRGNRVLFRVLIIASIFSFCGCAGLGKRLESPRVYIANIQVQEMRPLEAIFQVELRVLNPNDVALVVKGIDCDLELNGRRFASGVTGYRTEIPPFGTEMLPVTLYSSVLDMARGFLKVQGQEKLTYRISGRLRIGGDALLPPSLPFESEGQLDLRGKNGAPQNSQ